jgi:hypothetical protein
MCTQPDFTEEEKSKRASCRMLLLASVVIVAVVVVATAAILLTTGSAATADTIVGVGGALIAVAGGSLPVKLYLDRQDEIREIRSFASDWRRLEPDLERQERCDWMWDKWFELRRGASRG